jgi:hypothetical protein
MGASPPGPLSEKERGATRFIEASTVERTPLLFGEGLGVRPHVRTICYSLSNSNRSNVAVAVTGPLANTPARTPRSQGGR